jgi:hypothetical protein
VADAADRSDEVEERVERRPPLLLRRDDVFDRAKSGIASTEARELEGTTIGEGWTSGEKDWGRR